MEYISDQFPDSKMQISLYKVDKNITEDVLEEIKNELKEISSQHPDQVCVIGGMNLIGKIL